MEFVRTTKPRAGARRYRMTSTSDNGIFLYVNKYERDENYSPLLHHVLTLDYVRKHGAKVIAVDKNHYSFVEDYTAYILAEPVLIPAGTIVLDSYVVKPKEQPHISMEMNGRVILTHADWRKMKFEIDELFMLQNQMPWGDDDDTLEETAETTEQ